jgi:4-amino-4-deoxy-L-arabinose transferase-like glycosyltransferase
VNISEHATVTVATRPSQALRPTPEKASAYLARWALAAIVLYSLAQLVYLAIGTNWDLSGDEAEYWTWSRRLDWSYYAKGPVIALVIRLSTALAGDASLALTGSLALAVRLPAVLLSALAAWGIFRLASETCRSERAGLLATFLLPAIPLFRIGGLIITIDTPLVCFWTWAAVWSYRAIVKTHRLGWLWASAFVALGVATKYTMLAFPASVGLFLLLSPDHRRKLIGPGFWMLSVGCAVGMAPIVYWNAQNGWAAATQMSDRLGFNSAWNWGRLAPLGVFFAGEFAVIGLWWIVGIRALVDAFQRAFSDQRLVWQGAGGHPTIRRDRAAADRPEVLYLLCLAMVVWSACSAVSLLGETEANWSAPAHVSLVVLMGWWLAKRGVGWGYSGLWLVCVLSLTLLQHTQWVYPTVAQLNVLPAPTPDRPAPIRKLDPTCRMVGYRDLVPEVARQIEALRAQGLDPFVLAPTYPLTATLEFHLPGQPEVYCLGWSPGMAAETINQHDLWHPNPRHDLSAFRDRPAVIVEPEERPPGYAGGLLKNGLFTSLDDPTHVVARRGGLVVGTWNITVARGYKGIQNAPELRHLFKMYASIDYYDRQGGTSRGYIQAVYRDMVHRSATPGEEAFWVNVLKTQPREMMVFPLAKTEGLIKAR